MKAGIIIALLAFSAGNCQAQQAKKNNNQPQKTIPKTNAAGKKKLNGYCYDTR